MIRGALAALLGLEPDIEVVATASSGDEIVSVLADETVDVVLMDVEMPGGDGIATCAQIRARFPSTRVLIVTTFGRAGYVRRAFAAGASGFVVKDAPAEELARHVRDVHAGLRVIDPQLASDSLAVGINPLTPREREVLCAVELGGTISDIAARLHVSAGTVRNHVSAAMGKTQARTRADAARVARDNGWL
nr:response regulator transcription factor [Nanchangia anserum]